MTMPEEIPTAPEPTEEFDFGGDVIVPESQAKADDHARALRHYMDEDAELRARVDAHIRTIQAKAAADIAIAEEWYERRSRSTRQSIDWLTESIRRHLVARKEQSKGKVKSISFPSGILAKLTAPRGSVSVLNPDEFVEWATTEGHDDLLSEQKPPPPRTPAKAALAKLDRSTVQREVDGEIIFDLVDKTGEVVPGVHYIVPKDDTFNLTAGGAAVEGSDDE